MNFKKTIFPILAILTIFIGCEQYTTGFNYDIETRDLTKISGIVTNKFTDENVKNATVRMNDRRTRSGEFGEYVIHLSLGTDEQRDKPVEVQVIADNYLPFTDEFILYPGTQEYDIPLEYASPIVLQNALGFVDEEFLELACQVKILDYQGYNDIDSVRATFFYLKMGEADYQSLELEMDFMGNPSDTTAYFQAITPVSIADGWALAPRKNHEIYAVDKSGYSVLDDAGVNTDGLLFPPE